MANEVLASIGEIKSIAYVILVVILMGFATICFLGYKVVLKHIEMTKSDAFKFFAEELLDKGCYNELIKDTEEFLKKRPNHIYAQWYLAKAYYNIQDYENAKKYFSNIAKTELEWKDHVQPYLDEINDK